MKARAAILLCLFLTGCASTPPGHAFNYLTTHPDFSTAYKAAPRWVEQVLEEVSELEAELSRRR